MNLKDSTNLPEFEPNSLLIEILFLNSNFQVSTRRPPLPVGATLRSQNKRLILLSFGVLIGQKVVYKCNTELAK